jgi:hypothetical protein
MPEPGELYIRYSASDNGQRDIPAGVVHYASPALEIVRGVDAGTAQANDPNQAILVRVGNQGSNTRTDVMVQVYVGDFGTSNPWLQSLGGSAGTPGGPFTVVGDAKVQDSNEGEIEIGWSPAPSELGGATEKHVCLFANVHRPGDGAPQTDPPDWRVRTNQHHAQRNIKLRPAGTAASLIMGLHAANLGEETEVFQLAVRPFSTKRLAGFETRHLASAQWLAAVEERLERQLMPLAPVRAQLEWEGGKGEELKVELPPGEQIPLALNAGTASKEPGLLRFAVEQRSARTGEVVGAAVLIAAVIPEELIPERLRRDPDLQKY